MDITGWVGLASVIIIQVGWLLRLYLRLRFAKDADNLRVRMLLTLARERTDLAAVTETAKDGTLTTFLFDADHKGP
jgi:hypothetical protein